MQFTRGVLLVGLAGLAVAGPAASAPPTVVDIQNFVFSPRP
jgi:hypothetical protein